MFGELMKLDEGLKYVGIDESNNGKYPTIFVAVFSIFAQDAIIYPNEKYEKIRKKKGQDPETYLKRKLAKRDYRFVLIDKEQFNRYKDSILERIILTLTSVDRLDFQPHLLIDGRVPMDKLDCLENNEDLLKKKALISFGDRLDERCYLVNLADALASFLYHQTVEQLSRNKRKLSLI